MFKITLHKVQSEILIIIINFVDDVIPLLSVSKDIRKICLSNYSGYLDSEAIPLRFFLLFEKLSVNEMIIEDRIPENIHLLLPRISNLAFTSFLVLGDFLNALLYSLNHYDINSLGLECGELNFTLSKVGSFCSIEIHSLLRGYIKKSRDIFNHLGNIFSLSSITVNHFLFDLELCDTSHYLITHIQELSLGEYLRTVEVSEFIQSGMKRKQVSNLCTSLLSFIWNSDASFIWDLKISKRYWEIFLHTIRNIHRPKRSQYIKFYTPNTIKVNVQTNKISLTSSHGDMRYDNNDIDIPIYGMSMMPITFHNDEKEFNEYIQLRYSIECQTHYNYQTFDILVVDHW